MVARLEIVVQLLQAQERADAGEQTVELYGLVTKSSVPASIAWASRPRCRAP
jgi:hypothetical protein